jgi:hypothetical protein
MKSILRFSALALALLMAFTALAQEKSAGPPPKLIVESFSHDFGEIKAGTPLKFSFKVRNEGKGDLLIQNVAPG